MLPIETRTVLLPAAGQFAHNELAKRQAGILCNWIDDDLSGGHHLLSTGRLSRTRSSSLPIESTAGALSEVLMQSTAEMKLPIKAGRRFGSGQRVEGSVQPGPEAALVLTATLAKSTSACHAINQILTPSP